jgi:HlyD family secretion protein
MNSKQKWMAIGSVIVLVAGIGVMKSRQQKALLVPVVNVAPGTVESTVSNTRAGTVRACQRSRLSMSLGGRVEVLHVKEGDRVKAGQILLELWNKDNKANVAQAEANLSAAHHEQRRTCLTAEQNQREHVRTQSMVQKKLTSITQAEAATTLAETSSQACEASQDGVRQSQAALELAQARLELTSLRAPYAGVIAEVNSELGEYVTPSPPGVMTPPAVEILDDSCLYVTAPIDEVDAMPVQVGQRARITLDAFRGRSFDGQITRVAPYVMDLEKQARTVDVDVRFDALPADVRLLIGYSADIEIILEQRQNVLRVPTEAILDKRFVYVLNAEKTLNKREFEPGLTNWTQTEVKSGLEGGEQVVSAPDRPGVKEGAQAEAETP